MAENFFLDNRDLQFHLQQADLRQVMALREKGYANHEKYPSAPRNYEDARDNYRLLLQIMGDICANVVAPRAAEADEEGAQFRDGQVTYTAATQEALQAFRHAELYGVMLPWEYGGMNMPETIYQMMVEIVSRADAGLMTIFGLQEIAMSISEFGDDAMKARFTGMRYGDLKKQVADMVIAHLEPFQERYRRIISDPGYLAGVLADGAARVAPIANATVRLVKERMGLYTYATAPFGRGSE